MAQSNIEWIFVSQISKQLLLIRARREPRAYSFDLGMNIWAESRDVDLLQAFLPRLFLRCVLPEGGKHRIQVVMKVAFPQNLPLIPVKPDAFATFAMIDGKTETMSDEILDHTEATLRAVDMDAGLGK